jgi:hypothetical protein
LSGSDHVFPVAVFTGATLPELQLLAQGSGGLAFAAVQGNSYQIAVSDQNGLTGAIKLTLQAPLIMKSLSRTVNRGRSAADLYYRAASGEIIALLTSTDGYNWRIDHTQTAKGNLAIFQVRPPPSPSGPFYCAIFFDRAGR